MEAFRELEREPLGTDAQQSNIWWEIHKLIKTRWLHKFALCAKRNACVNNYSSIPFRNSLYRPFPAIIPRRPSDQRDEHLQNKVGFRKTKARLTPYIACGIAEFGEQTTIHKHIVILSWAECVTKSIRKRSAWQRRRWMAEQRQYWVVKAMCTTPKFCMTM